MFSLSRSVDIDLFNYRLLFFIKGNFRDRSPILLKHGQELLIALRLNCFIQLIITCFVHFFNVDVFN